MSVKEVNERAKLIECILLLCPRSVSMSLSPKEVNTILEDTGVGAYIPQVWLIDFQTAVGRIREFHVLLVMVDIVAL